MHLFPPRATSDGEAQRLAARLRRVVWVELLLQDYRTGLLSFLNTEAPTQPHKAVPPARWLKHICTCNKAFLERRLVSVPASTKPLWYRIEQCCSMNEHDLLAIWDNEVGSFGVAPTTLQADDSH